MYSDNNKSQGSVATHLMCDGLASLQNSYRYSDNNKSQGSVATYLRYGDLALLENYRSVCW